MTDKRRLIHAVFLTLAPIIVAGLGLSVAAAVLLSMLLLLWRWLIVVSGIVSPEKSPDFVLETISASHFVEKVRWSMDRLGIDYAEKPVAGTLGVFYRGRTVPQLKVRTGLVQSVIGNSADILRYLWGRYGYADAEAAAFLAPTGERIALERMFDRYGVNLQIWVYYRMLGDRDLTLHAWGVDNPAIPRWQRWALRVLFPLQALLVRRAFRISDESFARAVANIEELLADMNQKLGGNSVSLLGEEAPNYTDFAFASMTGLWLMPTGYGGGQAEAVRVESDRMPEMMRMDVESWTAAYPHVVDFVRGLYRDQRHL